MSRRWLSSVLDRVGLHTEPEACREVYAELPVRKRRNLRRRIERNLHRELRSRLRLRADHRRRLVSTTVAALLGISIPGASHALIEIIDDVDFEILLTGAEDISVDCDLGLIQVIDNETQQGQTANTQCDDALSIEITGDGASQTVDLSAFDPQDFSSPDITIALGAGSDTFFGGAMAETFIGGPGANTADGGAGDDILMAGPDANTLDGGLGNDKIHTGVTGFSTIDAGAGSDTVIVGAGIDQATVTLGDGADVVEVDLGSSSNYLIAINGDSADAAPDALTILGDSFPQTIRANDFSVWQPNLGTATFEGMESVMIFGGDEVGEVGDTIDSNFTGGFDVLLDGGKPSVLPGDTLLLSDPNTPHQGFETVSLISTIPALGLGGLSALVVGLLAAGSKRVRSLVRIRHRRDG
jgi:hypothetical protein